MAERETKSAEGSLFYDKGVRSIAYQVLLGAALTVLAWTLYSNVNENLERQGIATGWAFLDVSSGFDIGESVIEYSASDTYGRALLAGVWNTVRVAVLGIVFATILGVSMGIARVSRNWLLSTIASWFVEIGRNVPVVLHVIFWGTVIHLLPQPRDAMTPFDGAFIMNRGVMIPFPVYDDAYPWVGAALAVGIVGVFVLNRWAQRRRERTGQYISTLWPGFCVLFAPPLIVWMLLGAPLEWDVPVLRGFNFKGGLQLSPEFVALLVGITLYTSSFIAEIVRAGIQSVPSGQVEAARAVGLRPRFIMRYVVMPQALRVIVPPTASQYLSLTKNSSLGVLIGYPDLVNVGNTTLNQTGQAVEAIAIMMGVYLAISIVISTFMNVYNRLVAIKER